MARLRGADGCPWDRAQDYDSVKGLLVEEAYEVIDAVTARDFEALEEELGDLLFQVVFYSRLAEEEERFTIDEVIKGVHEKLVRRHPHVFGKVRAETPAQALKSWLAVKESERRAEGDAGTAAEKSIPDDVSCSLPSMLEAHKLGRRAAEVGFDWEKVEDLLDKIQEELNEVRRETAGGIGKKAREAEEEIGDLLLAVTNLARRIGSDAESCLRRANQKFKSRFQRLEQEARNQGRTLQECGPQELDSLWQTVKAQGSK